MEFRWRLRVIFITFNKNKIKFRDHRDSDKDTRYLVNAYNLADVRTIRKGQNNHGELIYSMDFEKGKEEDILKKQNDIKDTLIRLKKIKLTKNKKNDYIDNLKSYAKEFSGLKKAIKISNIPLGRHLLRLKEQYLTPTPDTNENKELVSLVKSMTPQIVNDYGQVRDIKEYSRIINGRLDLLRD